MADSRSPYKTVLSYTEDLRTFLRTKRSSGLATFLTAARGAGDAWDCDHRRRGRGHGHGGCVKIAREDLRPMHDAAMRICDDIIVSDVPLLFSPGEVGLEALMITNEYVGGDDGDGDGRDADDNAAAAVGEGPPRGGPRIDIIGYIRLWFQDANKFDVNVDAAAMDAVTRRVSNLGQLVRKLREDKHGCGNHGLDMDKLKRLNKKLKKCCAWGVPDKKQEEKKKKRKRKVEDA
jgi:cyclin H